MHRAGTPPVDDLQALRSRAVTPPVGDGTPHRGEQLWRCFGEEFRSPSLAGSPVHFSSDLLTVDEGLRERLASPPPLCEVLGQNDGSRPPSALASDPWAHEAAGSVTWADGVAPSDEDELEAAGLTAGAVAAEALSLGYEASRSSGRDHEHFSPLQPMPRRHVELYDHALPRSRPGTPSAAAPGPGPGDLGTPVRPTSRERPGAEKGVPEISPSGGWSLERPPTASTRPSTANDSVTATPSRLGSLSPESAGIKLDAHQMRGLYGAAGYPPSPELLPGAHLGDEAAGLLGRLPLNAAPFPAAFGSGAFLGSMGPIGERGPAGPHFRPMTAPPDFHRLDPPGPVPTSEREQAYTDLKGRVVEFSKSQVGSRYLQRQLRKEAPELVQLVVLEVLGALPDLMCDTYGNYLAQQLFGACNADMRCAILERLLPCAREIACDRRGTHSLQALVGVAVTPKERMIVQQGMQRISVTLNGSPNVPLVVALAFDVHGTHVVQRILACFDSKSADFIYQTTLPLLDQLAQHPYGLCVVKKCIAQANEQQKQKIIKKLANHATDLVISPYGNYAIQAAIEAWMMPACRPLILKLKGRILQLAIQKFSSNVVEKCIAVTDPQLRQQLIDELVADRNSMHVLMESQYGMFVIQKALPHAVPRQLQDMKAGIQKHVGGLHNRKMRSKWEKLLAQLVAMTEMPTGHTAAIPRMDELSFAAAGFSREAVPHAAPGKMAFAAPGVPLTSPLMRWPAPERA